MGDSMPTGTPAADRPTPPSGASLQEWTAHHLAVQAPACAALGSRMYARLLAAAADDVAGGGPAWDVLAPHATTDTGAALALRFMAAVHRLMLTGEAPALAAHYPSVGGTATTDPWPPLRAVLGSHRDVLRELVGLPCQTNEVNRCAALLPGFLEAARHSGLPLRVLEVGASGGLNLRWDHYRYRDTDGRAAWGPAGSPVVLGGRWDVPDDVTRAVARVVWRRGCDPRPVDPTTADGRLALAASVWGDQPLRFERLRAALPLAEQIPAVVDRARAVDWLPAMLDAPMPHVATVVYHSVVMQYLPMAERQAVAEIIAQAGRRARRSAPLYWLRMEPTDELRHMAVDLRSWPGGTDRRVGVAGAHGDPVHWQGSTGPELGSEQNRH